MITMMTTKDDDKSDEQKAQVNQRTSISRIKIQDSSSRIKKNSRLKKKAYKQESRFKIQEFKNQEEL